MRLLHQFRNKVKIKLGQFLCLLSLGIVLFPSCEKEQDPLPSYIQELAELHADHSGVLRTLVTDRGESLGLVNPQPGFSSDSVYRAFTLYTKEQGGARLYQMGSVASGCAVQMDSSAVQQSPVELISLWKTQSRWMNLHVRVYSGSEPQQLRWVWTRLEERETTGGVTKMLHLQIDSKPQSEPYHYTEEVYVSCPLTPFSNMLSKGKDSLTVTVNTTKGLLVRKFEY